MVKQHVFLGEQGEDILVAEQFWWPSLRKRWIQQFGVIFDIADCCEAVQINRTLHEVHVVCLKLKMVEQKQL